MREGERDERMHKKGRERIKRRTVKKEGKKNLE